MKRICYTLLFAVFLIIPIRANAEDPTFFSALHDIPVMSGLTEMQDSTAYDKPEGRIIDVFAITNNHSEKNIIAYYNETLPQLGWGATSPTRFYRAKEILTLSFEETENTKTLKISVRPSL